MNKKSPEKCAFRMNRGERDQKKKSRQIREEILKSL